MHGYVHELLQYQFEKLYLQAFTIDSIIIKTIDFFNEKNIDNDYNPGEGDNRKFAFKVGDKKCEWYLYMTNKESTINPVLEILVDEICQDKDEPHPILRYQISLEDESEDSRYYDGSLMEDYKNILDTIVNEIDDIKGVFLVRTNEGLPMPSTYVSDDFLYKFEMEISWMRSKKYVSDRISLDDLMKLDLDDVNYNNTVYRFEDRGSIDKLYKHAKDTWKLGKLHRIEHVKMNGLFYVENCDLQDISEFGYDTLTSILESKYKIVEVYENGSNAQSN